MIAFQNRVILNLFDYAKLVLLLIPLFTFPSHAKMIANSDLREACIAKDEAGPNFCFGFIISAANGAQYYRNLTDVSDAFLDICFPEDVSNKQLVETYLKWVELHPDAASMPAFLGVSSALSSKYSCGQNDGEESSGTETNTGSSSQDSAILR